MSDYADLCESMGQDPSDPDAIDNIIDLCHGDNANDAVDDDDDDFEDDDEMTAEELEEEAALIATMRRLRAIKGET